MVTPDIPFKSRSTAPAPLSFPKLATRASPDAVTLCLLN